MNGPRALPAFFLAAATLAALALVGCGPRRSAVRDPDRPSILSSPVGPALDRLWTAAGGLSAWTRVESLRLRVEIEWGTGERQGPFDLEFRRGVWDSLAVTGPKETGGPRKLTAEDGGVRGDSLDRALWSARFFACFPFVLSEPVWEFRRHLIAGQPSDPKAGFWVAPRGEGSPVAACYVEPDAATGRARTLLYQPTWDKLVFWVVLSGQIEADGLRLPREIVHYSAEALSGPRYPWEEAYDGPQPEGAGARAIILRQRILAVEVRRRGEEAASPAPASGPEHRESNP